MLKGLVSPSEEVIGWVADAMREEHQNTIEARERLAASIQTQIDRIERMDEGLYEDKLAGDISRDKYHEKHRAFVKQKTELEERLADIDRSAGPLLERRLVLLELSQKAAEIYAKKSPEQKRLIITKLFDNLAFDSGSISVNYTPFARAIAENALETRKLIGGTE